VITSKKLVYEFKGYKAYLQHISGGKETRRGLKAKFAEVTGCQPTYISQVLNGKAHLSQEQAERLSRYLQHTPDETQYFMLLLHFERAGTTELKNFYRQQIEQINEKRLNVVNRLGAQNTLTDEQKAIFYSSWHYLATLMALTVPHLRTREALADYFQIPLKRIDLILKFIFETRLATRNKNSIVVNANEIRLGKDSPHIFRHHAHWRHQAIESLEREETTDLHYSAVFTLSKDDILLIKERLLENIKTNVETVRASKEEEVYVYAVDFFKLQKKA